LTPKNKIRILIADKIDFSGLKQLPPRHFYVNKNIGISNDTLLKEYGNYDVLVIRSTRKINKSFLEKCSFKIIASCTKGLDHIDLKTAEERKIKIINSESGNTVSAAEHTFALILAIYKKIFISDKLVREGRFGNAEFARNELRGKRIGIVGFGKVGSRVAKYARAFEMQVMANDIDKKVREKNKKYNFYNIKRVISDSDILTIHIPLNDKNRKFVNIEKLELLPENAILINTSRGEVIDEKVLIKQLKSGKLYYAGLDVFENEPSINKAFYKLGNVLLTNHIAGKTEESIKYISNDIFMQVKNFFK
jgi:D-3-phosphoglycerate dehydrogenase